MGSKLDIRIKVSKNTIGSDLRRALAAAKNPQPALRGAAQVVVEQAKRSFTNPGLRPSAWAALSAATLEQKAKKGFSNQILRRKGVMMRTPRVIEVTGRRAIVGSDSFYARFHQLGEGDMYRPFWPFDKEGNMTPEAQRLVRWVLKKRLGIVR